MQRSWIAGQSAAFNSWVSGYIDEGVSYLKLKQINEDLVAQNKALMVELYGKAGAKILCSEKFMIPSEADKSILL
jgi:rod shape-determining protein MreC